MMNIIFDPIKDNINFSKHQGISLSLANSLEWDTLWAKEDKRIDYGEVRIIGYAYIKLRLFCVVYTDRGDNRRIISLRKANKREIKGYAEA